MISAHEPSGFSKFNGAGDTTLVSVPSVLANVCVNRSRFSGSSRLVCLSNPFTATCFDGNAFTGFGAGCSAAALTGFATVTGNMSRTVGGSTLFCPGASGAGNFPAPTRCVGAFASPLPDIAAGGTGGGEPAAIADVTGNAGPTPVNGTANAARIANDFAMRTRRRAARDDSLDTAMKDPPGAWTT